MNYILFTFFFLLGIAFGSFANVIIMRLRTGEKGIMTGRSHCPKCQHLLHFFDLIPLFSWLFLKGKCRYCSQPIAKQYPLIELILGLIFAFVYLGFVFSGIQNWFYLIWLLFIFFTLFLIFVYDFLYMEIPDEISLPTILILFGFTFFPFTPTWQAAFAGASIPLLFFGVQFVVSKGKWIGEGDFRLGIIMGLILGWKLTIVALCFAYILGSIIGVFVLSLKIKKLSSQLPFGPFLILGTILSLIWGTQALNWYWGLL